MEKISAFFLRRCMIVSLLTVVPMAAATAGSASIDWNDPEVRRQAIIETAYAYYLKSDCVQYDSAPLIAGKRVMHFTRKTIEKPPEHATPHSTYYTVCSAFPYET